MDKLNELLLIKIEGILGIKFYDWQKDYILDRPQILVMSITGRATGKTLAYVIKLLFKGTTPIRAYEHREIELYSDWYCVTNRPDQKSNRYTEWFRLYLRDIYTLLTENGINTRPIFWTRKEENEYMNRNKTCHTCHECI